MRIEALIRVSLRPRFFFCCVPERLNGGRGSRRAPKGAQLDIAPCGVKSYRSFEAVVLLSTLRTYQLQRTWYIRLLVQRGSQSYGTYRQKQRGTCRPQRSSSRAAPLPSLRSCRLPRLTMVSVPTTLCSHQTWNAFIVHAQQYAQQRHMARM